MIGGAQLPFRLPCHAAPGDPSRFFFGSPFQHNAAAVPAFGNTTQMQDHCGNTIGAKSLLLQLDVCGNDVCGGGDCNACPGGQDLTTNTTPGPKIADNTWSAATGTVQLEPARKLGFKPVQAFKAHHGDYGFLHDPNTGADCATGALSNTKYRTVTVDITNEYNEKYDYDDVQYGTATLSGSRSVESTSGEITSSLISAQDDYYQYAQGAGGALLPAVQTKHTSGGAGYTATYSVTDGGTSSAATHQDSVTNYDSGMGTMLDATQEAHCANTPLLPYGSFTWRGAGYVEDWVGLSLTSFVTAWNSFYSGTPDLILPAVTDQNNYSESVTFTDTSGETTSLDISWSRTDTSFTFAVHYQDSKSPNAGLPEAEYNFHGSITLSDAYTCTDVYNHATAQSLLWLLTDDAKYPFRTDGHTTVAPLVLRNEVAPAVNPEGFNTYTVDDYENPVNNDTGDAPFSSGWVSAPKWDQRAWFDPVCYQWEFTAGDNQLTAAATGLTLIYDGAMVGAPLAAGYGQAVGGNPWGVYDKDHANWFERNCIFGIGWSTGIQSVGNFTPDFLPGNAQKWTDDFHATTLWPCDFLYTDSGGVYLQKGCEIRIKRPSVNFARPYGPDKFTLDETAVYFMADNTAGVVTLKNGDGTSPTSLPFTGADIVGGASIGGFYHVSAVGADTVTLGAKVYDVPAGWDTPSKDGAACFGKLRYPNAPGMDFLDTSREVGGRVQVTATDGIPVTLATATTQTYLSITAPENVDILDAAMVLLASNVAATRVDANHFTVPTAFSTIAAAKWIVPHGSKYKFADNRSKGDYVLRTWTVRISDSAVLSSTQQDACLEFSPCGPSMAGFTPNGESLPSADFYAFPAAANNGEVWLGQIQFWMVDPFWQQPHVPVAHTEFVPGTDLIIWSMDDGTCQPDHKEIGSGGENIWHLFYALHPFVEARCTLPVIDGDTPPAPLDGLDITAGAPPPNQGLIGEVDGPLVNAIVLPVTDWSIYANQQSCIAAHGQFAADYEADS